MHVEVLAHGRPKVSDVVIGDIEPSITKTVGCLAQEVGVEGGDAVDDQAEAERPAWSAIWRWRTLPWWAKLTVSRRP